MKTTGKGSSKYKPKARIIPLSSAAWRRLRAQVLAEEPLCRWCMARGLYVPSTEVDHIKDSREDYSDDNRRENLTAMCHECHSLKTARDMGKSVYLGCDLNGMPLDPSHPWNREASAKDCEMLPFGDLDEKFREKSRAVAATKTAPALLS